MTLAAVHKSESMCICSTFILILGRKEVSINIVRAFRANNSNNKIFELIHYVRKSLHILYET